MWSSLESPHLESTHQHPGGIGRVLGTFVRPRCEWCWAGARPGTADHEPGPAKLTRDETSRDQHGRQKWRSSGTSTRKIVKRRLYHQDIDFHVPAATQFLERSSLARRQQRDKGRIHLPDSTRPTSTYEDVMEVYSPALMIAYEIQLASNPTL
ncbi:hypothetical protein LA080_009534 [Diaporthe eres]|nr:hypothetical protein LA080_009534 [Diaporthe eres]